MHAVFGTWRPYARDLSMQKTFLVGKQTVIECLVAAASNAPCHGTKSQGGQLQSSIRAFSDEGHALAEKQRLNAHQCCLSHHDGLCQQHSGVQMLCCSVHYCRWHGMASASWVSCWARRAFRGNVTESLGQLRQCWGGHYEDRCNTGLGGLHTDSITAAGRTCASSAVGAVS
jgi:hypothetical protein